MNELMEKDLENAKKDLKDKQEKLQWFMEHDINSERFEYNMITVLTEMTGLSDMSQIETYITDKQTELSAIMSDVSTITSHINTNYTYTEADVVALKGIIDKYNIPITEG